MNASAPESCDIIVIGAGVSGLSFAHLCARSGRDVLVLEAGASAGGCVHSERLGDGGFWFELGAHTCYNSYGALLGIIEPAGAGSLRLRRRKVPFRLWTGGRTRSVMSQLALGALLARTPRLFTTSKSGRSVADYYGALVGARNYRHLFSPLFAAVFSQPADGFPADMMFKRRPRRKDVPRSYTFRGGLSSMLDVLLAVPRLQLRTGAAVRAVRPRPDGGIAVELTGGEILEARHACIAVPPPAAAAMVRGAFPALGDALARIASTKVESLGVVARAADLKLEPVTGIVSLDGGYYSAVSRDTVPDPERRAFTFHFGPGGDEEERLALAGRVLGVEPARFEHVARRQVVLPSPALGHAELVAGIERALAATPLFLTGNYFDGLAIEDCALRSQREHQRLGGTHSPTNV